MAIPGGKAGARARIARIKEHEAREPRSYGPVAEPSPDKSRRHSPLYPTMKATESMKVLQGRQEQEKALGFKRGRKAAYTGE